MLISYACRLQTTLQNYPAIPYHPIMLRDQFIVIPGRNDNLDMKETEKTLMVRSFVPPFRHYLAVR